MEARQARGMILELISAPQVVTRPAQSYVGIRMITPFRGMLSKRDELLKDVFEWVERQGVQVEAAFLQLHVIDMNGPMDIEVGVIVSEPVPGSGRLVAGTLPGGDYATLTYRDHAIRANRALLDWAAANTVTLARQTVAAGDQFNCRYERYVTDPRQEPRKTRWIVELNMLTSADRVQ